MFDLFLIDFDGFYWCLLVFVGVVGSTSYDFDAFGWIQSDLSGLQEYFREEILGLEEIKHSI